jgi:hypothetical protein
MPSLGHNPNEAEYFQRTAAHRRALVRHWPWVLAALVAAIAIGVASPDRSKPASAPVAAPPVK